MPPINNKERTQVRHTQPHQHKHQHQQTTQVTTQGTATLAEEGHLYITTTRLIISKEQPTSAYAIATPPVTTHTHPQATLLSTHRVEVVSPAHVPEGQQVGGRGGVVAGEQRRLALMHAGLSGGEGKTKAEDRLAWKSMTLGVFQTNTDLSKQPLTLSTPRICT